MGDMADYYNELQEEGGRYFPPGDPYRVRYAARLPTVVKCKHCGARCVWGTATNGAWALQDAKGTHDCRASAATADDFDDVS